MSYFRDVRVPFCKDNARDAISRAIVKSSGLDLPLTLDGFAKGGKRGPAFVAGTSAPDNSLIIKYLKGDNRSRPCRWAALRLPAEQIASISAWISLGAKNDTPAEVKDNISQDHPPLYHQRRR